MTAKWVPTTNLAMLRRMGKTIEELSELSSVCARCIIQGIDEIDPATGKTNRQRLTEEIADVDAQLFCTVADLHLDAHAISERSDRKRGYMRDWESMFGPADGE